MVFEKDMMSSKLIKKNIEKTRNFYKGKDYLGYNSFKSFFIFVFSTQEWIIDQNWKCKGKIDRWRKSNVQIIVDMIRTLISWKAENC